MGKELAHAMDLAITLDAPITLWRTCKGNVVAVPDAGAGLVPGLWVRVGHVTP